MTWDGARRAPGGAGPEIRGTTFARGVKRGYFPLMRHVSIERFKNDFEALARLAEAGERVVVTRDGEPVLDLTAHEKPRGGVDFSVFENLAREHGVASLVTFVADDFDAPLPENFLITPLPD